MFSDSDLGRQCDFEALQVIEDALKSANLPAPMEHASLAEISGVLERYGYARHADCSNGLFHGYHFFTPEGVLGVYVKAWKRGFFRSYKLGNGGSDLLWVDGTVGWDFEDEATIELLNHELGSRGTVPLNTRLGQVPLIQLTGKQEFSKIMPFSKLQSTLTGLLDLGS